MRKAAYSHFQSARAPKTARAAVDGLAHARAALKLASTLGVDVGEKLVVPSPLLSRLCGTKVAYLRGWSRYAGCIKAFNALGLLAEHAPDLDLRKAYAERPIVCATSSNLGICLHEALMDMRRKGFLKKDEGRLVIWCPDKRADFMSPEKSAMLERLARESRGLTTLKPYMNRQQRDPGALRQALELGGHFFPTNPQSREELANLLALAKPKSVPADLGAEVVGGMFGMAAPYLLLLDQAREKAVSLWNPVSIGAALAAMTHAADRSPLPCRMHGVFDIANLQSLAQLFGVVVKRHRSGRKTAYVGLGSSSYATGNLCYDILRGSAARREAFRGKKSLHPATHTLNPVAQALVYAELGRKPEPAGAAGLAGYLLARLDGGTLSTAEVALGLREAGYSPKSFLSFAGFDSGKEYVRDASEEGPYMEAFARGLLAALDDAALERSARTERARSLANYRRKGLDDAAFEAKRPLTLIHLTGDYCVQPKKR